MFRALFQLTVVLGRLAFELSKLGPKAAGEFVRAFRSELEAQRAGGETIEDEPALPLVDRDVIAEQVKTLEGLLTEIDDLCEALPEDAKAIGVAARSLVETSLEECRKPVVDAARLAKDLNQVGALALAIRERLLLAPRSKKTLRH